MRSSLWPCTWSRSGWELWRLSMWWRPDREVGIEREHAMECQWGSNPEGADGSPTAAAVLHGRTCSCPPAHPLRRPVHSLGARFIFVPHARGLCSFSAPLAHVHGHSSVCSASATPPATCKRLQRTADLRPSRPSAERAPSQPSAARPGHQQARETQQRCARSSGGPPAAPCITEPRRRPRACGRGRLLLVWFKCRLPTTLPASHPIMLCRLRTAAPSALKTVAGS